MRYYEIINESSDAELYHFTDEEHLFWILKDDCLGFVDRYGKEHSPSLTRDVHHFFSYKEVGLIIDGRKLRQNYKITPRFGDVPSSEPHFREAEEKVNKPIQPLSKYLKEIVVSERLAQSKNWSLMTGKHIDDYINLHPNVIVSTASFSGRVNSFLKRKLLSI